MIAWIIHNFAPLMFLGLVVFLLLGYPVAFALAANGLLFAFIGIELGILQVDLFKLLPERVFGIMRNETLLAIPFFTFMGLILERSGMAEDLLDTIGQLFGPVRGGLAYAVIFVGALLAATTGVVAASVISMGLISLPIMMRYGYDRRLSSGVIAASGTLAQIIPPSLVLIVLADQMGRSVGDMYKGALVPGLVLTGLYAGYVLLVTIFAPARAPALPRGARPIEGSDTLAIIAFLVFLFAGAFFALGVAVEGTKFLQEAVVTLPERFFGAGLEVNVLYALVICGAAMLALLVTAKPLRRNMLWRVIKALVPPLMLIFLVLGTIFIGIATPTEGGAMGATGALILAILNRRLNWSLMRQAMDTTAKLSSFVIFILIGAQTFSLFFNAADGHHWVEGLMANLPGGVVGFLIVVNILVFLLAFFLDFFELAFIIVPLLAPVAEKLGINLIWFGVVLGVNMQTSFMHPPFGFALFYLRSVAPDRAFTDRVTGKLTQGITTMQIYWGAVPFVVIQCIMVGLVITFPELVTANLDQGPKKDPTKIEIKIDVPTPDIQVPNIPPPTLPPKQ
jgi:TRAP-type mannitol/chloroaromatic compound transport system permease large subunit